MDEAIRVAGRFEEIFKDTLADIHLKYDIPVDNANLNLLIIGQDKVVDAVRNIIDSERLQNQIFPRTHLDAYINESLDRLQASIDAYYNTCASLFTYFELDLGEKISHKTKYKEIITNRNSQLKEAYITFESSIVNYRPPKDDSVVTQPSELESIKAKYNTLEKDLKELKDRIYALEKN